MAKLLEGRFTLHEREPEPRSDENVVIGRFPWRQASLTDELTCEVRRLVSARHTLTYREFERQLGDLYERAGTEERPGAYVAQVMWVAHHAPSGILAATRQLLAAYGGDRGYLQTALAALDNAPITQERATGISLLERELGK